MSKGHDLKTWQPFFDDVKSGKKTFEYRKNDRDFEVGDVLILYEYNPNKKQYTGEAVSRKVVHIVKEGPGLPEDFCIMGIEPIKETPLRKQELPEFEFVENEDDDTTVFITIEGIKYVSYDMGASFEKLGD